MAKRQNNFEKEFLGVYDKYSEALLKHIGFRVSDHEMAKDIMSDTFLKMWEYLKLGNEIQNSRGFLYKIANNLVIDFYRKKSHHELPLSDEDDPPDPESHTPDIDGENDAALLKRVIETLPEIERQIITYRYLDELTISEIRDLTGKSAGNIYVISHRALKTLKKKLKDYVEH